jgi:hypothetical protein
MCACCLNVACACPAPQKRIAFCSKGIFFLIISSLRSNSIVCGFESTLLVLNSAVLRLSRALLNVILHSVKLYLIICMQPMAQ